MTKKRKVVVKRGELSDIFITTPFDEDDKTSTLSGSWSCNIAIIREAGDTALQSDTITLTSSDNRAFHAYVSPTITTALSVGKYIWVIQVENLTTTPPFNKEEHIDFIVEEGGIP